MALNIKNPFRTGSGAVTRAATDAAAARQGRAQNLTMLADSVFSDPARENQTQDFMGALRTQLGDNTRRGYADTARGTKFATARRGLTGGSVDASRQKRNLEDLFRRQIGDEAQVQDAGNSMRTQDRASKQAWLDSAYGTADIGQSAARGMIGQQAQNSQYLSTLLPQWAASTGAGVAGGYSRRAELDAYRRGMGGA